MKPENVNTFVIVIRGNEVSEYYYEQIKESWESNGFKLNRFDAYHPGNYDSRVKLNFGVSNSNKYVKKQIVKEYTPSEKAAFVSHYMIWKRIFEKNIKDALIIEHDSRLRDYELFEKEWDLDEKIDVKLFGQGASCYRISPRAAGSIRNFIHLNPVIDAGPMGYIADMKGNTHPYNVERTFEKLGGEIHLPVEHIYNKDKKNTIDKYSNIPKKWARHFQKQQDNVSQERWVFVGEENE